MNGQFTEAHPAVFSIDQDDRYGTLSRAIWEPAGLSESAGDIVASIGIEGLDGNGYLREDAFVIV